MKWSEEEIEKLKKMVSDGFRIKEMSNILNRTYRSVERKIQNMNISLNYIYYDEYYCLECGDLFKSLISHNRKFCSKSCSAKFSNKNRDKIEHSLNIFKCKSCGENCLSKIDGSNIKCDKCKLKCCIYCDEKTKTKICDKCKNFYGYIKFYEKLKIFENNKSLVEINELSIEILEELYYNRLFSRNQISEYLKIDKKTLFNYFKKNDFKRRTLSESINNALTTGRLNPSVIKNQYKSGYHITWENKKVYYRSSYELNYCNFLDNLKVSYEMEFFRIKYYDSFKEKYRISIPDFYLPSTNEIVEIKSTWTYNEQNMIDRFKSYEFNGFTPKLILDGVEHKIIY